MPPFLMSLVTVWLNDLADACERLAALHHAGVPRR